MKFTTTKTRLFALLSIATSVLIMASCTSSNSSNSSSKKNNWMLYNLSGKVKSINQTQYYKNLSEFEKGGNVDDYYNPPLIRQNTWTVTKNGLEKNVIDGNRQVIFNQKGNTVEIKGYDSNGDGYKCLYKYDKQGNRIKENIHDSDGDLARNRLYDEKGNLIEENEYYYNNLYEKIIYKYFFVDRNLEYKTLYKYDEDGNLIEKNNVDLKYKTLYKYDGKGNLIEKNEYDSRGHKYKTLYKYDEKGNLIERYKYLCLSEEDYLAYNTLYKYDEEGNLIEENIHDSDGDPVTKQLYDKQGNRIQLNKYLNGRLHECLLYDEKGNIIEKRIYESNGDPIVKMTCKYDEKGNYVEAIRTNSPWGRRDRTEYKYEYEFDNKGNWINRLGFKDDRLIEITEREIEYFD